MDDAALVGLLERLGDLLRRGERVVERQRAALEPRRQVLSGDELQHQEQHALRLLEPVDGGDVRVIERREQLRLAAEAGEAIGIPGEHLGQELESDVAREPRVPRPPHLAHPAGADRGRELVGTEPGADLRGHGESTSRRAGASERMRRIGSVKASES